MKNIRIVAYRELRGYFDQATAYILLVAFLALGLFLLFRSILAQQVATLRPFFDLLPWLFAVFVPAITMRSLAEERRGRTLEWLMAQPLTESDVLLGKFLGDWSFVLIGLAATLPTAFGILLASDADAGIMVGQYVGAALLGAQMVAIGLWCSAVTRNQITAFILGAGISFLLILIGLPVVQIGLPPVLAGMFARLSVLGHFNNVARGVIDLRDVVYFLSVTALFLMLAGTAVGGERLSHARGAWRRLRLGTIAVAVLVVFINLLGGYIRGRLDLTRDRLYTLAPGSRQILGNLDDVVNLKLFVSRDLPPEVQLELRDVRDLVSDLRRASDGRLHVEEENPDKDPAIADEARSLGIQQIEVNVLRNDEYQVRRGWFGIALTYADKQKAFPVIDRTDDLEYRLVSAISTMTEAHKPRITFVTGFQAKGPYQYQALQQMALGDRYDVRTTALDSTATLSKDSTDVVAIIAPEQPLDSMAVQKLDGWVDGGGSLLLLIEPITINPQSPMAMPVRTGLDGFLVRHGVRLRTGMVYDLQSHANVTTGRSGLFSVVRPYPLWPIVQPAGESNMTRSLNNLSLAWSGALDILDTANVQPLWETTDQAGLLPPEGPIDPSMFRGIPPDSTAPEIVAVAVDPDAAATETSDAGAAAATPGRMVVVADAMFLQDQFVSANPQNVVFVANAIDWLTQSDALIRIRSKNRAPPSLTFASAFGPNALKWGNLVGVPVLLALFGLLRIGGRRRRAIRRWEETGERG